MISFFWILIVTSGLLLVTVNLVLTDGSTIDENSLFSGQDTMVDQSNLVNSDVGNELNQKHIGVLGK